jgi:2-iminobutanoate/2-iminopropanoate deaminase
MSIIAHTSPDAVSVGPYSHAAEIAGFVYLSGQTPLDKGTGKLVEGGIAVQTDQVLKNLESVLKAAGLSFSDVVKVQVFLTDMKDFPEINRVYESRFSPPYPARSTLGVAALPLGAKVEIEMIAARSRS